MSQINPSDLFPHPEITPIPSDIVPDFTTLKVIHRQLNANAIAIPSTRGGGQLGHLALVIPAAQYNALPHTAAWIPVVNAGPIPILPVGATAAQIAKANRVHKNNLEEFKLMTGTVTLLKRLLIASVPDTFLKTLKDDDFGYANVNVLTMLTHLNTTHGTVTADDLDNNIDRLNVDWSPTQPIEDLWNQIEQYHCYAQPHDPITELAATRLAIQNRTNSGVFTDAIKDWRKHPTAKQTWLNVKLDFNTADRERRHQLMASQAGFANKATGSFDEEKKEDDRATMAANATMSYCWSHGCGPNVSHSSTTCTNPQPDTAQKPL